MQLREIRVSELEAFVESDFFRNAAKIPITPLRAKSLANNPSAKADDIVLIAAYSDEGELLSYVGALPDKLAKGKAVTWNSGWYAHPEKGKTLALPIFLQFVKHWQGRIILRDLTEHTRKIISGLPYFMIVKTNTQYRFFTRFYFADLFRSRKPHLSFLLPILKLSDTLLNCVPFLQSKLWLLFHSAPKLEVIESSELDEESSEFVDLHNTGELIGRGSAEIRWILNYPWLMHPAEDKEDLHVKYHFSTVSQSFRYICVKVKEGPQMVGFMMVKERDSHFELPYFYSTDGHTKTVLSILIRILMQKKSRSLATANPLVIRDLRKLKFPHLFKRTSTQELFASKELLEEIDSNALIQDGDGDVVFT